jgi:AcrR family transcriptional regulator
LRVAAPKTTEETILDGAIQALSRHGVRRLSMSDICEEAGVSRGTLYRYFKSKEDVLDAVNTRIEQGMKAAYDEAVAANPALEDRVRVVLKVAIGFPDKYPHMRQIILLEPGVALNFMTRELPSIVKAVAEYLKPALVDCPPVAQGILTERQIAEIFMRLVMSSFLLPTPGSAKLDSRIADLWESLVGDTSALYAEGRSRRGKIRAAR